MIRRRKMVLASAAGMSLACVARWAVAQDFPARKHVTIIVGWPPSGVADYVSRVCAEYLASRLKQNVLVENRPGATGTISLGQLARAAPDGYVIGITSPDTQSISPQYLKGVQYRNDDFAPIGTVAKLPMTLCVSPKSPFRDAKSLLTAVASDPRRFNYASWGNGSLAHVTMELFLRKFGGGMVHVPYQGAPQAVLGTIAGDVTAMVVPLNVAQAYVPKEQLRMLGTFTSNRVVEGYPTLAEQGYAFEMNNWFGFLAPRNTPPEVVTLLARELASVADDPGFVAKIRSQGFVPFNTSLKAMKDMMDADYRLWGQVLSELNIRQ